MFNLKNFLRKIKRRRILIVSFPSNIIVTSFDRFIHFSVTHNADDWTEIVFLHSEAVPSINYIGRQLDVSYIGREMYGGIVFFSNTFLHELSVSEYCPSINTYIWDPYIDVGKGKAYYEFDLNSANYLKHRKLYFDLISNSYNGS